MYTPHWYFVRYAKYCTLNNDDSESHIVYRKFIIFSEYLVLKGLTIACEVFDMNINPNILIITRTKFVWITRKFNVSIIIERKDLIIIICS